MQHIGVLMNRATDDPEGHARVAAFTQGLQDAGFTVGRDVQIDVRWGADDLERERTAAMELLALAPDIILASGTLSVAALRRLDRTVPIVFFGTCGGAEAAHGLSLPYHGQRRRSDLSCTRCGRSSPARR
jgi:putative tryptophan/tyrosine transport system substrate-binding protein